MLALISPVVLAVSVALFLKSKILSDLSVIFFPFFIIVSFLGFYFSSQQMGYVFKRPPVFSEVKDANKLLKVDTLKKEWDELRFSYSKPLIEKPRTMGKDSDYWYNSERFFLAFEKKNGTLFLDKALKPESKYRIPRKSLNFIQDEIIKSKFLDVPALFYEEDGNNFFIQIVKFSTEENKIYQLVTMMGQTTGLDTEEFPLYEFLFDENGLIKKQKYYYSDDDMSPYLEYPNLSPFIEMFFLIISLIIYKLAIYIRKIYLRFR